jgi:hypothetical protein
LFQPKNPLGTYFVPLNCAEKERRQLINDRVACELVYDREERQKIFISYYQWVKKCFPDSGKSCVSKLKVAKMRFLIKNVFLTFRFNTQAFPESGKYFCFENVNFGFLHVFIPRGVIYRKNFRKFFHMVAPSFPLFAHPVSISDRR